MGSGTGMGGQVPHHVLCIVTMCLSLAKIPLFICHA